MKISKFKDFVLLLLIYLCLLFGLAFFILFFVWFLQYLKITFTWALEVHKDVFVDDLFGRVPGQGGTFTTIIKFSILFSGFICQLLSYFWSGFHVQDLVFLRTDGNFNFLLILFLNCECFIDWKCRRYVFQLWEIFMEVFSVRERKLILKECD